MPLGEDDNTISQKAENGTTGMAWQLARPQSYRKPVAIVKNRLIKQHYTTVEK